MEEFPKDVYNLIVKKFGNIPGVIRHTAYNQEVFVFEVEEKKRLDIRKQIPEEVKHGGEKYKIVVRPFDAWSYEQEKIRQAKMMDYLINKPIYDRILQGKSIEKKVRSKTDSVNDIDDALWLMGFDAVPDKDTLKKTYKAMILKYHPDRCMDKSVEVREWAATVTKNVNKAMKIIEGKIIS